MTLPITVRSGITPVQLLRAAGGDAEAADDLVEDQQRAAVGGELAQQLEEAAAPAGRGPCWPGRARRGSRRARAARPRRVIALAVVPRDTIGRRGGRLGHARRGGDALGGEARAGLGEQAVDVAVVGAGELDSVSRPVAARASRIALIDASVPEEVMRSISTDGTRWATSSASSTSAGGRRAERRAVLGRRGDRGEHRREGVAVDQRAPRADVVDVGVAVDVGQLRALGALDEHRIAPDRAHRAHRRVDAAGEHAHARGGTAPPTAYRSARRSAEFSRSQSRNASVK